MIPRTRSARLTVLVLALAVIAGPAGAGERSFSQARAALSKGLRSSDPAQRSSAVWELDGFDTPAAARVLVRQVLTRDDHARVIRSGIELAGGLKSKEAIAVLVEESAKGAWIKRSRVIEALGSIETEAAVGATLVAAYDKDPRVRTSAILSMEHRKGGRAAIAAGDALKAEEWPVRSAAIYVLARMKDKDCLPALIRMLGKDGEQGRLLDDAGAALKRLTNEKHGLDFEYWKDWYVKKVAKEEVDLGPSRIPPKPRARFGRTSTNAKRVVFVLQISRTMNDDLVFDPGEVAPRDVRRKGGAELKKWQSVKTKIDLARLWVAWGIDNLSDDAEFNIITFGVSANTSFSGFIPATKENRAKAKKRVLSLSASGSGNANIYAGLQHIFSLHGRDVYDEKNLLSGPEAVFFVSDGSGDEGEIKEPFRAFEEAEQWNRVRQISFHCFGVGEHDSRVLADLAGMTPGGSIESLP
jgi:hypothetical protein